VDYQSKKMSEQSSETKVFTGNFKYHDHTADIQFQSWGKDLSEAFQWVILAMFNYITDLLTVDIDDSLTHDFEVEGHDLHSLLYAFMDEFLYQFAADGITCKKCTILEFDRKNFKIKVKSEGEKFSPESRGGKHPQNAEIKAITYSNMQIHEKSDRVDIYVIVDI